MQDQYAGKLGIKEFSEAKQVYEKSQELVDLYKSAKESMVEIKESQKLRAITLLTTESPLTDYVFYSAEHPKLL